MVYSTQHAKGRIFERKFVAALQQLGESILNHCPVDEQEHNLNRVRILDSKFDSVRSLRNASKGGIYC